MALCGHSYYLGTVTLGEAWVSMLELASGACNDDLSAQAPVRRASSSEFLLLSSALNVCSRCCSLSCEQL